MPISTIASYLSTAQEIITHWEDVDTALAVNGPLELPTAYDSLAFINDRTNLQTKMTAVVTADNAVQVAAGNRDILRAALRERLRQFRAVVQGLLRGTKYVVAVPTLPRISGNVGDFVRALEDVASLWATINASPPSGFTGPLLLAGGYTLASFNTNVTAMRAAFSASDQARQEALLAREERNALMGPFKARMVQYRRAVEGLFASGSPLIESLPLVSPPPGATPDPVVLSGLWDGAGVEADLSWTASADPDLKHYAVRACDPPRYRAAEEQAVGLVYAPDQSLSTTFGLGAPGTSKIFKVYVVTQDDNEKGSNSVRINRPV